MMESDTQSRGQTGTGSEQHFIVDGCKVTVRYSEESDPRCAKDIKFSSNTEYILSFTSIIIIVPLIFAGIGVFRLIKRKYR